MMIRHFAVAATLLLSSPALAYQELYRDDNCQLIEGGLPVHTFCVVQSGMWQGVTLLMVRIPDGRQFRIENSEKDLDAWTINYQPATQTPNPPYYGASCYLSRAVKLCLSR